MLPAPENTGVLFCRIDLKEQPFVPALIENVSHTKRRTVVQENGVTIETIEHLLAAIYAYSINNLIIEIDGAEIPILDGSAKLFAEEIEKAGIYVVNTKKNNAIYKIITHSGTSQSSPLQLGEGDSSSSKPWWKVTTQKPS